MNLLIFNNYLGEYVVKAIDKLKIDKCIIFCRTKLDCDNLENHLNKLDRSNYFFHI